MNRTSQGNIISGYGSLYRYYQPVHLCPNNTCEKETQTDEVISCRNTASLELETDTMGAIISMLHTKVISLRNQLNENHANTSSTCINQKNDYTKSPTKRYLAASIDVDMDASDDHEWKPKGYQHRRRKTEKKTHRIFNQQEGGEMVPIGDGYALVPATLLEQIDWSSYRSATRKLLNAVFPKSVLATHSLSGKPSRAFWHRPAKKRLEPKKVNDIIQTVVGRCRVPEKLVRTTISMKCTEESKMYIGPPENNKQEESSETKSLLSQDNVAQSPYDVD